MHTTIKGTDIKPLKAWRIGHINEGKAALLVAELEDGSKVTIGMPPRTAIELGQALKMEGENAFRPK